MFMKKNLAAKNVLMLGMFLTFLTFLAGGCQEQRQTVWFFGDEELTAARFGIYVDEVTEVGGIAAWFPHGDENVDLYGIYGLHYFDAVNASNPFDTNVPGLLSAVPYVGVQAIFDLEYDEHVATVGGLVFGEIFFVEHQYDPFDNDETKTMVGVRVRF